MHKTGHVRYLVVFAIVALVISGGALLGACFVLDWRTAGEDPQASGGSSLPLVSTSTPTATTVSTQEMTPTASAITVTPSPVSTATPTATRTPLVATWPTASPAASPAPTAAPTKTLVTAATPTESGVIALSDPSFDELTERLSQVESGQEVRITMSQETLHAELQEYTAANPDPTFRYQSLRFEDGVVVVAGQAALNRLMVGLEITARPQVVGCWFELDLEQVKLGRFAAPAFVVTQAQELVDQYTQDYEGTALICIQEIRIEQGRFTFVGEIE